MPVVTTAVAEATKALNIPLGDIGDLNIRYRVAKVTCEELDKFDDSVAVKTSKTKGKEKPRRGTELAEAICGMISEWDYLLPTGEAVPLEVDEVKKHDALFLLKIINAINEDQNPPKKSSSPSSGSFGAEEE